MKQALINGRVFDGVDFHPEMAVLIEGGVIAGIVDNGALPVDVDSTIDLDGNMLAPGFVDLQVNGGGGRLFNDSPDVETVRQIAEAHRRYGSTSLLMTLITDTADVMLSGIRAVDDAICNNVPGIRGIHLEGPHLEAGFRGVHDASKIREATATDVELLLTPMTGVKLVTLAPENVSREIISQLRNEGILVFAGHSAATYEETRAALDAGLDGFTHLFNAMPQLHSREPGMVGAALEDRHSYVGVIADGIHVHSSNLSLIARAKECGKVVLVTDAMPSVGSDDPEFTLNGEIIVARDGQCVTADGRLAGANIGMNDAVRNMVQLADVSLDEALRMASTYPATALGLDDQIGYVRQGYCADLIEFDENYSVRRSWIAGDCVEYGAD